MAQKVLEDIKLTLFFSAGTSLKLWNDVGNLHREVALYKRLKNHLGTVNFITYGGKQDYTFQDDLCGIKIYPSYWICRPYVWTKYYFPLNLALLIAKHKKIIQDTDILKTNQISGSQIPIWLKKIYGKKMLVRCGNLPARLAEIADSHLSGIKNTDSIKETLLIEKSAFQSADLAIVATKEDRQWVLDKHMIRPEKIRVIPNYVETGRFIPMPHIDRKYDLIIVAKNSLQKNIGNLIEALYRLQEKEIIVSILFVGKCGESAEVKRELKQKKLAISVAGNIDSKDLPLKLAEAEIFILPSYYEGCPKVLLEAMSSAMPSIATDVEGINNIITHRKNGYLCNTDSESIAEAIKTVLEEKKLQVVMGNNARDFMESHYSLERILKMELDVIKELEKLNS